jgi:C1A family cysteine protease
MRHTLSRYGWLPDTPDQRDLIYAAPKPVLTKLPSKTDLRTHCPPIYDQGSLGSCTANAIGAAFEFGLLKQSKSKAFMPSRLFIYYNERVIEHSVESDSGAMIRDGIKTVHHQGVCGENLWPYNIEKFAERPEQDCYSNATNHQVLSYHRVNRNLNQMKSCLADGYPFVFGFTVYESFESATVAKTGKVNMPKKSESTVGGHAVMATGYDNKSKRFLVRNSWGPSWGLNGYFTMPFDYLMEENLSDDFWTIRLVEVNPEGTKKKKK